MTDLTHLEELAKAATPGPWKHSNNFCIYSADLQQAPLLRVMNPYELDKRVANLKHVAACSPDKILELIEFVRELEKEVERLSKNFNKWQKIEVEN